MENDSNNGQVVEMMIRMMIIRAILTCPMVVTTSARA